MNKEKCDIMDLFVVFGKKWTIPIFYWVTETPISYNRLRAKCDNKVNPTLLSSRLKSLAKLKLIERKSINGRIVYVITSVGCQLKRIIGKDIKKWAIEAGYMVPDSCIVNNYNCDF
jgi:DNA-binding HxlR family transcriptional regulator